MGVANDDLLRPRQKGITAVSERKTVPTLTPIGNRILLRRVDMPELLRPESLIELPENTQELSTFCDVVAVGPDVKTATIVSGVRVMVQKYAGMELTLAGDELLIVSEGEIFGILTGLEDAR